METVVSGSVFPRLERRLLRFRGFARCDLPDIARLLIAMVQARDAVESRSWSHPQEPTTEQWWADVLADPRARISKRRSDYTAKQAFYRLADELRDTNANPPAQQGIGDWSWTSQLQTDKLR